MKGLFYLAIIVCVGAVIFWAIYIPKTIELVNELDTVINLPIGTTTLPPSPDSTLMNSFEKVPFGIKMDSIILNYNNSEVK